MIEQMIEQLGFTKNESLVYATLLANSPAGASQIAKKCNLSRSSVYTALSDLQAKSLVSTTYKNEVKQFVAEGYAGLADFVKKEKELADRKFSLLENLKSQLEIISNNDLSVPQIMFFEGQEGLKKIYLSMLRQSSKDSTMYILRDEFVWQDDWSFVFDPEWHQLVKHFKTQNNVQTKMLVNDSELERSKLDYYKSRKALKYKFLSKSTTVKKFALYIMGDTVSILSMESGELVGIRMVNRHLAQNFIQIFENLWQSSLVN